MINIYGYTVAYPQNFAQIFFASADKKIFPLHFLTKPNASKTVPHDEKPKGPKVRLVKCEACGVG